MKAVRLHGRGGPEQLVYEDAPPPEVRPTDALVRVRATGITPTELDWVETWESGGRPRRFPIPGHELCGVVEEVPAGAPVSVGDEVYGLTEWDRDGTLAQYTAMRATDLAPKPVSVDHAAAATLPLSALTAWQALVRHAGLAAGQTVLIHGAAGGVGSFAVQLARHLGARVVGTASPNNRGFVGDLGADDFVDYTATKFEKVVSDVDVVLDTVGGDTLARSFAVVRPGGTLVSIAEAPDPGRARERDVRAVFFIVEPSRPDLLEISRLVDGGRLRPIVSAVLPLAEARRAYEQGLGGHNRGKIVLLVDT